MDINSISPYLEHSIYIGTILILVLCGLGLPFPEELTFLAAGYIGAKNGASVELLCAAGLFGIMAGDSVTFMLGRRVGMPLLKHRFFGRIITQRHIDLTQDFFRRRGSKAIFIARFLAGVRAPTFFMAGASGVRFRTFFAWDLLGALISCPTSIWLAYNYGEKAEEWIRKGNIFFFGALAVIALILLFFHLRKKSAKAAAVTLAPPPPLDARPRMQPANDSHRNEPAAPR